MEHPIEAALESYPTVEFTRLPTPLHDLPRLTERLGGPRILVKRDDLTDLTLGGDKPRKLGYEIAHALELGADMLVTCGAAQSNHARLTTAAARRVGLDVAVLLSKDARESFQGNLLTVYLMGAEVHMIETDDHWDLLGHADELCERLRAAGRRPHFIPISGTTPHSNLGYVRAGLETLDQLAELGVDIDALYTPFGTGGIFTSMMLAMRARGIDSPVVGISVNRDNPVCDDYVSQRWKELESLLPVDGLVPGPYELYDEFVGAGYGDANEWTLEAIKLVAETDAVLLDPVYSGKTFAGLIAHIREGRWGPDDTVLAVHSGGVPALFAYAEPIASYVESLG